MARTRVNVSALYAALDAARTKKELSWRQLAAAVGVSPSTMTRMANGNRPDVDAFAALVRWLGMPAETFMVDPEGDQLETRAEEPELMAQLAPLLRARGDLGAEDVKYLEEVIGAAMRRFASDREARSR
ncbi:helix-turn-helix domain-containing protein [Streptomyces fagopyri]|uniref:Helix-turn-helix domain-containing protein n=1 Tax=Streptomyces fagopyri TaxID=2662397 RepID=A0A5Q0LK15_9ACTN|nr:helix-turn-helix transcriptional regulator [Streptomyces fagopyri]QFZ77388.1 helix-turn-helix domain-containing protein [Streptomyces fagopyri]